METKSKCKTQDGHTRVMICLLLGHRSKASEKKAELNQQIDACLQYFIEAPLISELKYCHLLANLGETYLKRLLISRTSRSSPRPQQRQATGLGFLMQHLQLCEDPLIQASASWLLRPSPV